MFKGIGSFLREARGMQEKLAEIQEGLKNKTVSAVSGGGMVEVVANGQQEIVSINIKQDVFASGDKEFLEDLIVAACNNALGESKKLMESEVGGLTNGLDIAGLFGKG